MKAPLFSILHATYGRAEKAIAAMNATEKAVANPGSCQYILAVNWDDPMRGKIWDMSDKCGDKFQERIVIEGPFKGSAEAWNAASEISTGSLLIQAQDDVELPYYWDELLIDAMTVGGDKEWEKRSMFVAVSDGYRKDALCCTAIMTRARMEQVGYFLWPGFLSVYSDDDVSIRAIADGQDGKCTFVNARHIVFKHEHYVHNNNVPYDATYARENSSEAYALGQKLFRERNQALIDRGLKTWQ